MAVFIEEHGDLGAAVLEEVQGDVDTATRVLEEDYIGEYQSLADCAEQLTDDTVDIPEAVACYIDYEAMGRDMELAGEVFTIKLGWQQVHIFWNR